MNYDRYFAHGQRVFLINISENRDLSVYESVTATVVKSNETKITLRAPYRLFSGDRPNFAPGSMFKLTTESLGMGIQLCAELADTPDMETMIVQPVGNMEIYQRRSAIRIDTKLPFLHVPQKSSLSAFRQEWKRVVNDLQNPVPPKLRMQIADLSISVGGIRFETSSPPTPLSIVVVDLDDNKSPVCAVVELVWHKKDKDTESYICGHRFLEILKEDQARLAEFTEKSSASTGKLKNNRELHDRID